MTFTGQEPSNIPAPAVRWVRIRSGALSFVVNEGYLDNPTVQTIVANPEAVLSSAEAVLTDDRRSRIVKVDRLILKRFNRRSISHGVRGMIRMSDAARTWDRAWRLRAAGLPTAEPVAYADRRVRGFWTCSYLVLRAVPKSMPLGIYLAKHGSPPDELVRELASVIARFHNAGFYWNRDLNDRNILISKDRRAFLIDVDGVRIAKGDAGKRQLRDLETLREALSAYPQLSQRHTAIFMRTYVRIRPKRF